MDRHIYRPVPERMPLHNLTSLLSQGSVEDLEDNVFDAATQSGPFSDFLYNTPLHAEAETAVNLDDDNNVDQLIMENTSIPMTDMLGCEHEQEARQQAQPRRKRHVDSPHLNSRARWTVTETITLIEAKRAEKDLLNTSGVKRKTLTSTEKWRAIEKYCHDNSVMRSDSQCRDRWEHILPEYKKVRDYERNIPSGHSSYWSMTIKERQNKKLPSNYIEEIFHAMEQCFGRDRAVDPGDISIDTSSTAYGTFNEFHSSEQHDPPYDDLSHEMPHNDDTPSPNSVSDKMNMQSTGKKRKSTSRIAGLKDTLSENNRLIVDALHMAEERRTKRHEHDREMFQNKMERDAQKMERDEQREERMIRIEEQKAKTQTDLVAAMNLIGQAMVKISQSFEPK